MKALIAITTCNRISDVKKYIWDYLFFVNNNTDFHFVLALDGKEDAYTDFCYEFDIPMIFSEEREGVGLSKNRVLSKLPDYSYYFFLEDDVELLDGSIFNHCIDIYKKIGYPHLCGNTGHELFDVELREGYTLNKSFRGGGYFSFFAKQELDSVGGWNTLFAKYKRYGHTEHSYRFYHSALQPAPFIFAHEVDNMIMVHSPESVTKSNNIEIDGNELVKEERELIESKSTYFPLNTLSNFYFNNKQLGYNEKVNQFLKNNPHKYPLTKGSTRKKALGEFFALQIHKNNNSHFKNITLAIKSMLYAPMNNELKHAIKFYFKK